MALLADFGAGLLLPSGPAWRVYGGDGWLAPATSVSVGSDGAGKPLVHLSLTRAALPGRPPDPFAMLDMTVICTRDLDASLIDLRDLDPDATLRPLAPSACQIDLGDPLLSGPGGDRLDVLDTGQSRMIRGLSWESGLALEAMLQSGTNPFLLSGAAAFAGISPRVGTIVQCDGRLIPALQDRIAQQAFTRNTLETTLLSGLETLPITGIDGIIGTFRTALCSALADRIFDTATEPLGQDTQGLPLARLIPDDHLSPEWDMLTPWRTTRWLSMAAMDGTPLDCHLGRHGAQGLVTRSTLPVFPRNQHRLDCHVNFPSHAPGVHALGVTVQAAAHPPQRPAAATASGVLDHDRGTLPLTLKLSVGEPLEYALSCFCVVDTANGVQQFFGATQQRTDTQLVLSPGDFGVRIHDIGASAHLLGLARLELTCRYQDTGRTVTQVLAIGASGAAVIAPGHSAEGTMTLNATAHDTGQTLTAETMMLRSTIFSAHLFAGYGPQSATITMTVDQSTEAVDVLPGKDGLDGLQTLAFDRDISRRSYRYFSQSPFVPGFRYRRHGTDAWTYHPDPQVPLSL